jgi:hypothetical protein
MSHKRCSTKPLTVSQKDKFNKRLAIRKENKTLSNAILPLVSVPIIYHVLYNNDVQNIPLERIKANHNQINLDFVSLNSDYSKIPTSGIYNFDSVKGTPNILFRPLDYNDLQENVHVFRYTTSRSSYSGLNQAMSDVSPIAGYLNVYIANIAGNILGQAFTSSSSFSACIITYFCVGSSSLPGIIDTYTGRTLTHEIGHTMSLDHPWESGCSSPSYPDVPATTNPNYNGDIDQLKFGNKYNDLAGTNGTSYQSCTDNTAVPPGYYELFFQYMEYVTDNNMVMFTDDQSIAMSDWLDTVGSTFLPVQSESTIPITEPGDFPDLPDVVIPDEEEGGTNSTTIIIIVSVIVGVLLLIGLIVWGVKSKNKGSDIVKTLSSYNIYNFDDNDDDVNY